MTRSRPAYAIISSARLSNKRRDVDAELKRVSAVDIEVHFGGLFDR
jgi:hypothetical protein